MSDTRITIPTLQPLTLPLAGSQLIEASAGTGKTFTIALLYVRLVLGHGDSAAFPGGPLTPPEILVVTFTEAATEELRDRIRARLAEAAQLFRAAPDARAPDGDPLRELRAATPPEQWPACARRLELAAEWMDEAAVSTIHGWCNRMLREHAFDSQSLFTQQLESDPSELRGEVVRDYWRNFLSPLAAGEIALVAGYWPDPAALDKAVKPLLEHAGQFAGHAAPAAVIGRCLREKTAILARVKAPWPQWTEELQALLDQAAAAKQVDGRKLRRDWYSGWLAKLRDWAGSDAEQLDLGKGWQRLTPDGIAEAWKGTPPAHPAFAAIAALPEELAALPDPRAQLLGHAAHWVADAFAAAQKRRARIGFDDLLTGLDAALAGAGGERLAATIRRQFPVALIDEFQDTDPVQYRIFDRVYDIAANRPDTALILIGDPKQAIYAFRGADIYTYLQARQAVAGRLSTLATNFRSSAAMVAASNHCFAAAEERRTTGAFLFRRGDANPVPFQPVLARGRSEQFMVAGEAPPAMTLAVHAPGDKPLAKTACQETLAAACATQIVAWLNAGTRQQAGFAGPDGWRPLAPGDIAILVNKGSEARIIRKALAQRGVRSVYLSDRDSVYASPQADEIRRWLAACADPDNERLLRAALATPTLGLAFAELEQLNHDEEAWEARVVQFKAYRELWQRQGVLPLIRRLLIDFNCSARLLAADADDGSSNGERQLTDLLHLAELLQQASFTLDGEHALLRFLAEQIAAPAGEADGRKLRLESDAERVKVITIHKSKGLEYPLVFLPFIAAARLSKASDLPLPWHDDAGELHLALTAEAEILARADSERLGEDLRKLYVALTRARHLTWLGLAPLADNAPSAIGHLFGVDSLAGSAYGEALRHFAAGRPEIAVTDLPPATAERFLPPGNAANAAAARRPTRPVREHWRIASYSALRLAGHTAAQPAPAGSEDTAAAETLAEAGREILPPPQPTAALRHGNEAIHRFFKGAEAGTFLHDLLEGLARDGFAQALADPAALRESVARRCRARGWEVWEQPLSDWLQQMLTTPLPLPDGQSPCLREIALARPEMEFWFAAHQVDLAALDRAVTTKTLAGRPRPALAPEQLNGMLKGFMDLVFEWQGRYYVADYKSNWLGPDNAAYHAEAMEAAIRAHRYDLQYTLYLFALHRLLKSRLGKDYNYEKHVGGAVYLFLRGIGAPGAGVHHERPPAALMAELDRLFSGSAQ